jgi:ATP-dependent helicase HrpA
MVKTGGLPWNAVQFDVLLAAVRDELDDELISVAEDSLRALWTLRNVRAVIDAAAGKYPEAASDVRIQIRRLIYDGFLTGLGADRLADVHRYLEAIDRRLARLPEDPGRDEQLMHRVQALEAEFDDLQEALPPSRSITDIAWMLQELRVSLFAQTLGTREKVSEKRIRSALTDVAMNG